MAEYLLGIDVGGTGVKAAIFRPDGQLVGLGHKSYQVHSPRPGWAEADPEAWVEAFLEGLGEAYVAGQVSPAEIACVGLSNMCASVAPFDRTGRPLRPAILYFDQRSVKQADAFNQAVGPETILEITGNRVVPGTTSVSSMLWIKENEPEVYNKTRAFALANTFLLHRLTGEWALDWTNAAFSGLFDHQRRDWSEMLISGSGLDGEKLPPVVPSTWVAPVSQAGARQTGLSVGTPVAIGAIDGATTSLAIGAIEPNQVFEACGTSDILVFCTDRPQIYPEFLNRAHIVADRWVFVGTMTTAGAALQWFRNTFYPDASFEEMTAEAQASVPGARGLIFLPYMMGERSPFWDPYARGVFFGLSLSTTRADMARAVLEGAAYGLRYILELAAERAGIVVEEIKATGGGARNQVWSQIKADVWNKVVRTPHLQETAVLGAAMLGGVGSGLYRDVRQAVEQASPRDASVTYPHEELYETYRGFYEVYRDLYPALADCYPRLWAAQAAGHGG